MRPAPLIALSLTLALGACDRETSAPAAEATPSPTPAGEKVSIIRDDVGIEREPAPPMAPLMVQIGFDDGGADLSQSAVAALEKAITSDQIKAGGAITLGGHTDSDGDDEANLRASKMRAEAVRDWLVDHGIAAERIAVIAFGEQNPVAPNARPDGTPDEKGRAVNRRVELTVAVPPGTPPAAEPSEGGTLIDELTAIQ